MCISLKCPLFLKVIITLKGRQHKYKTKRIPDLVFDETAVSQSNLKAVCSFQSMQQKYIIQSYSVLFILKNSYAQM